MRIQTQDKKYCLTFTSHVDGSVNVRYFRTEEEADAYANRIKRRRQEVLKWIERPLTIERKSK